MTGPIAPTAGPHPALRSSCDLQPEMPMGAGLPPPVEVGNQSIVDKKERAPGGAGLSATIWTKAEMAHKESIHETLSCHRPKQRQIRRSKLTQDKTVACLRA